MGPIIKKDHKLSLQITPMPNTNKQVKMDAQKNKVLIVLSLAYKVKNLGRISGIS
jgi:hypothetical protein